MIPLYRPHPPGSILQSFMPLFVPENGHPDELLRYHNGLLHQSTAVLPHVLQDLLSSCFPALILTLSGHSQSIDQSLRKNKLEQFSL